MDRSIIYENYEQLVSGVFHYQNHQNELRIFCLKIIIGSMAIIGLLTISNLGFGRFWFSIFGITIPFLSLFTITSGLLNDLFYREQLKMGYFFEAVKMEQEHEWLPEFHNCLLIEESGRKYYAPGRRQISFYKRCVGILLTISALFFCRIPFFSDPLSITIILCAYILFFGGYFYAIDYFIRSIFSPHVLKPEKKKQAILPEAEKYVSLLHAKGKELSQTISDTKIRYKNLTLTIFTMIFLGAAYIVGSENRFFSSTEAATSVQLTFIQHNKIFVVSFLTSLVVISVSLVRFLDVNISHAQIRNIFKNLKTMEEGYPNLAQPFTFLSKTLYAKRFDPILIESLFYASFNIGIIILMTIFNITELQNYNHFPGIIASFSVLFVLLVSEVISFFITYKQKRIFH